MITRENDFNPSGTYELDTEPLGRIRDDGTGQYALRHKGHTGVICYQRFTPEDADFWSKLLNAQAEKAWQEGHDHYGEYFSPNFDEFGVNPYTVKEAIQ